MKNSPIRNLRRLAFGGLLALALATTPAAAHHDRNIVAPLAAFIAFNALLQHKSHRHYRRHGHHGHSYYHHRRHSHSHGGYHGPKRKRYQRW